MIIDFLVTCILPFDQSLCLWFLGASDKALRHYSIYGDVTVSHTAAICDGANVWIQNGRYSSSGKSPSVHHWHIISHSF